MWVCIHSRNAPKASRGLVMSMSLSDCHALFPRFLLVPFYPFSNDFVDCSHPLSRSIDLEPFPVLPAASRTAAELRGPETQASEFEVNETLDLVAVRHLPGHRIGARRWDVGVEPDQRKI